MSGMFTTPVRIDNVLQNFFQEANLKINVISSRAELYDTFINYVDKNCEITKNKDGKWIHVVPTKLMLKYFADEINTVKNHINTEYYRYYHHVTAFGEVARWIHRIISSHTSKN